MSVLQRNAARAFWVAMLLGHIPAVFAAIAAIESRPGLAVAPRLILLALSLAFFSLKIANVYWLRLPRDRSVVAGVVAICVLLHADVVRRTVNEDFRGSELVPTALVTVAAGTLATITLRRIVQRFETTTNSERGRKTLHCMALRRVEFEPLRFRIPILQSPAIGLRAPPF